jgi:hypothetical protein
MHEAGEKGSKIKVTGRSFYIKNNLNLRVGTGTEAGTGTVDKKFGTRNRNRNLGKMARFRNTVFATVLLVGLNCPRPSSHPSPFSQTVTSSKTASLPSATSGVKEPPGVT